MQKLYFGIIAVIAVFSSLSCKQVCVVEGNLAGMSMPESKAYVVSGVPTSVLIDCSTGLIVGRELYGDMLDAKLEEIL